CRRNRLGRCPPSRSPRSPTSGYRARAGRRRPWRSMAWMRSLRALSPRGRTEVFEAGFGDDLLGHVYDMSFLSRARAQEKVVRVAADLIAIHLTERGGLEP